ncbi:blast:L-asparaginase-like protein GA18140 [Drosophila guanche]|uniref:Blast:L-asparaginase-like protein GA18140 n=1 Tax=Drosophila guanche TaxID=7266 RepID=A0A3B0J2K6_DROGU|nr:blast:L-asparaginase-like protein GA18140 [Drosophila guanche]
MSLLLLLLLLLKSQLSGFLPLMISALNYTDANREAPNRFPGCLHCQFAASLAVHPLPKVLSGSAWMRPSLNGMAGIRNSSGVAHDVLRYTNHSLGGLVGEAAARTAEAMGHEKEDLSTSTSRPGFLAPRFLPAVLAVEALRDGQSRSFIGVQRLLPGGGQPLGQLLVRLCRAG